MVKYLVGLATQFRNKKCVTYLAGLLIIIFKKSPPGQLNCRVTKYFWGQSPNGSVIWPGQLIGTQEYTKAMQTSKTEVLQTPSAIEVHQSQGVK